MNSLPDNEPKTPDFAHSPFEEDSNAPNLPETVERQVIIELAGTPRNLQAPGEKRRWYSWLKDVFLPWTKRKTVEAGELAERATRAKTIQEENKAAKLAQEAALLAAEAEEKKEAALKQRLQNIDSAIPNSEARDTLKAAALLGVNPQTKSLDEALEVIERLQLLRGTKVEILPTEEPGHDVEEDSTKEA